MSVFTENEIAYLIEQHLGRLATVNDAGQPHVVPVGFRYAPETDSIAIGGHDLAATRKYRDIETHAEVAFVVDDLVSTNPWRPRMIEIRGTAETFSEGGDQLGPGFGGSWIRITPERINAFNIDPEPHRWSAS